MRAARCRQSSAGPKRSIFWTASWPIHSTSHAPCSSMASPASARRRCCNSSTRRPRSAGTRSCRTDPTRSEMDLSYVGLVELIGAVDDEVVNGLPAPQARVLRMVLRREEPDEIFDRLSLSVAVVAALRALASSRPVLIAVDDVQWLDHPTARALAFVVRRLGGTPTRIALVRSVGGWSARTGPDSVGEDAGGLARGAGPRDARRPARHRSGSARSDRASCPGSCAGCSAGCRPGRG